jgi:predicted AlkP superfamily pyrophosphatase or phosphodiesterase
MKFWVRVVPGDHCFMNEMKKADYEIAWLTSKSFVSDSCKRSPLCECAALADTNITASPSDERGSYINKLADAALSFSAKAREPFVIFIHVNPDHYGHDYGENSARYLEEFKHADTVLGQLMDVLPAASTKFVVVADHGFDEDKDYHRNAADAWMAGNIGFDRAYWLQDNQKAYASLIDFRPTLLEFLGIDWQEKEPVMRGKSLLESAE